MKVAMMRNGRKSLQGMLVVLAACVAPLITQRAWAGDSGGQWWGGVGLGGAAVHSRAPAPSAGRDAIAASAEIGFRVTREFGLGLEYGGVIPVDGCPDWECAGTESRFAPNFSRVFAFGEFRPGGSGWRVRAGGGVSRFCYAEHWSENAWSWFDTLRLLLDDAEDDELITGSGAYRCGNRMKALGGSVSLGYDWPARGNVPVSVGMRLTAEGANFGATPAIGLPAFRYRAVMLTLHLSIN